MRERKGKGADGAALHCTARIVVAVLELVRVIMSLRVASRVTLQLWLCESNAMQRHATSVIPQRSGPGRP